jgi:hypothetical protein
LIYGELSGIISPVCASGGPMKKKKKSLFSIIYIGVTVLVIAGILIFGTSLKDIGDALKNLISGGRSRVSARCCFIGFLTPGCFMT